MNIIDSVILVIFMIGILSGLRHGALKLTVNLVGTLVIIVLAFMFKNPVAEFLYQHFPFFKFTGDFANVPVINILLYETIAFLIVCTVLGIILSIILKVTGVVEKIFDATIVLGLISKLVGGVLGFIQAYVIVFILLFFFKQPFINITGVNNSKLSDFILYKTPVLAKVIEKTSDSVKEIYVLKDKYKDEENKDNFNKDALDVFLKNKIITVDSVKILKEKKKLEFSGLDSLIEKYGG